MNTENQSTPAPDDQRAPALAPAPGSASDVADANGSVYARLKWWKDRADDDADEIQRLRDALRAIADESLHHGEYNPISNKTLLPLGYQKIHRMAMSALQNNQGDTRPPTT